MNKVISANELSAGLVVYFKAPSVWTENIDQAKLFTSDSELENGLKLAKADEKHNIVVEPFAVDMKATSDKGLQAVSLRNAIRAKGPTVDFLPKSRPNPGT